MRITRGITRGVVYGAMILSALVAAPAAQAATPAAHPGTASAASVPDRRLHPPEVSPAVSCGYYSGKVETVRGNTGNRVREVQCLLLHWGYSVGSSGVDGDFGPATESAVKAFQADTYTVCGPPGLVSDGRVGTHTWSALRAPDSCPTE
ncbi:peptidoglycan-binding protein [Amycolatopsis sp. FBCC-B4732]|uniref:peptidoglycan-binding domain-containing protein n=1 Tax=Amycolatopsis sp. FBCC-B4732 TaxID=3079339 RepID=UPI001FF1AE56|nr:peptidoglycan-binding domain-containing protein [Amycolatopsis sp. FBCC-B4732]UOX85920.1 peptidoglycan-binding protein [Amycolatopsis sp. FBCC-B4732]